MQILDYNIYLDKVYGCWMGKCISGNVGAPYEGMKQLLDFEYNPVFLEKMLPNDDLDLQVLWLEVIEKNGLDFTSEDLAKAFSEKCPYAPGEYAYFKKNYRKGIHPPLCGVFDNKYYFEGMGSPIRSEIWACVAPGNPELAAKFAEKDAILDHYGNSVYGEMFLSALQSLAFVESDLDKLIQQSIKFVPNDQKLKKLIIDVVGWCKKYKSWKYVRSKIISHYGNPDCTNVFQNIGIIILALYFGKMDFIKTTMIALNCGYDTDCTCATAGAIIGIIQGASFIMNKNNFDDVEYKLGVNVIRSSYSAYALAVDTAKIGVSFSRSVNQNIQIQGYNGEVLKFDKHEYLFEIAVQYKDDIPAIAIGESKKVKLSITNISGEAQNVNIRFTIPEKWESNIHQQTFFITNHETYIVELVLCVPPDIDRLFEKNLIIVNATTVKEQVQEYTFGLSGAHQWMIYGPFWKNIVEVPKLKYKESYWSFMGGNSEEESMDIVRQYHLNTFPGMEEDYLKIDDLINHTVPREEDVAHDGRIVNINEDYFMLNDLVGFTGQYTVYMVRKLYSDQDMIIGIQIGHTDPFEIWLNGISIAQRDCTDWCTSENVHKFNMPIQMGVNSIVIKLARRSVKTEFNLFFSEGGACSDHIISFASVNLSNENICCSSQLVALCIND